MTPFLLSPGHPNTDVRLPGIDAPFLLRSRRSPVAARSTPQQVPPRGVPHAVPPPDPDSLDRDWRARSGG